MKHLVSLLFLLFLSHNAYAGNLCDESCELTITFPDAGSIEAVEALTFTFGDSGFINDGAVTTGYSAGDTLSLVAGETIEFLSGGVLDLGVDGNLEYTNISITDGTISLAANGGAAMATIYNMSLKGELVFNLNSDVTVVDTGVLDLSGIDIIFNFSDGITFSNLGSLNISSNVTFAGQGTTWVDTVNWSDPDECDSGMSNSTITASGSATVIIDNTSCAGSVVISNPVILAPLGGGAIVYSPIIFTGTGTISGTAPIIISSDITLSTEALTQEFLALLPDGIRLDTTDGKTCTTTAGECLAVDGAKYVVVEGNLVPEETEKSGSKSNGALGWFLFLLAFCLVCCRTIIYNTYLRARFSFLIIK